MCPYFKCSSGELLCSSERYLDNNLLASEEETQREAELHRVQPALAQRILHGIRHLSKGDGDLCPHQPRVTGIQNGGTCL